MYSKRRPGRRHLDGGKVLCMKKTTTKKYRGIGWKDWLLIQRPSRRCEYFWLQCVRGTVAVCSLRTNFFVVSLALFRHESSLPTYIGHEISTLLTRPGMFLEASNSCFTEHLVCKMAGSFYPFLSGSSPEIVYRAFLRHMCRWYLRMCPFMLICQNQK